MRVPQIQHHFHGSSDLKPPPPPPPLALTQGERPVPPKEMAPDGARSLIPLPPTMPLPRPPPKLSSGPMLPTPPLMPPPAHAVILARKDVHVDEQAVAARLRPPPPIVQPPPDDTRPSFVHRHVEEARSPNWDQAHNHRWSLGKSLFRKRMYKPVPDWVVMVSDWSAKSFVAVALLMCGFTMYYYGTNQDSTSVWATHAATLVGCIFNLGLFESMKCVVIGCVALVKAETAKRQSELDARILRMALKSQRQHQGTKNRRQVFPPSPPRALTLPAPLQLHKGTLY